MKETTFDIKLLSVVELKALAYDLIVERDRISTNISIVNKEMQERAQAETPKPEVAYVKDLSDRL